jgi:hypothetical protein
MVKLREKMSTHHGEIWQIVGLQKPCSKILHSKVSLPNSIMNMSKSAGGGGGGRGVRGRGGGGSKIYLHLQLSSPALTPPRMPLPAPWCPSLKRENISK